LAAGLLVALLALAGAQRVRSQSGAPDPPAASGQPEPAQDQSDPGLAYEIAIEGVDDPALRDLLGQVSESQRLIDRPPSSLARLRRRAQDDRPRLLEVLRSQGYYAGQVEIALNRAVKPIPGRRR
jgi:hypothetical protein